MIDDFDIKICVDLEGRDFIALYNNTMKIYCQGFKVLNKYKSIRKLKEHDHHCCLQPSFSFFFLIFRSSEADFLEVEGCIGMYGGVGMSVSRTED